MRYPREVQTLEARGVGLTRRSFPPGQQVIGTNCARLARFGRGRSLFQALASLAPGRPGINERRERRVW